MVVAAHVILYVAFMAAIVPALTAAGREDWKEAVIFGVAAAIALGLEVLIAKLASLGKKVTKADAIVTIGGLVEHLVGRWVDPEGFSVDGGWAVLPVGDGVTSGRFVSISRAPENFPRRLRLGQVESVDVSGAEAYPFAQEVQDVRPTSSGFQVVLSFGMKLGFNVPTIEAEVVEVARGTST